MIKLMIKSIGLGIVGVVGYKEYHKVYNNGYKKAVYDISDILTTDPYKNDQLLADFFYNYTYLEKNQNNKTIKKS